MNEPSELVSPFRLAFRVEGKFVNCYFAPKETMEGAFLLGSIAKNILDVDPSQFQMYRTIMQAGLQAAIKDVLGCEVAKFETEPAPEHERSGSA